MESSSFRVGVGSVAVKSPIISVISGVATLLKKMVHSTLLILFVSDIFTGHLYIFVKQDNMSRPIVQSVIVTGKVQYSYSTHVVLICIIRHHA